MRRDLLHGRRSAVWLLCLPLMLAGTEGGHWLAYRLAYPSSYQRELALAQGDHGYQDHAPALLAVLGALLVAAFVMRALDRGGRRPGSLSPVPFVILPLLAFPLQECVEQGVAGRWPLAAALAPTFLPGCLAQVPLALLVFALARWLLRAADRLRLLLLGSSGLPMHALTPGIPCAVGRVDLPRLAALASGRTGRGPPVLVAA